MHITKSINITMAGGSLSRDMNTAAGMSQEPYILFDMNPIYAPLDEDGTKPSAMPEKVYNLQEELQIPSSYILMPQHRVLTYLSVTYKIPSLPEANIPVLDDEYSDVERITAKRDWIWKQPRKELDVMICQFEKYTYEHQNPINLSLKGKKFIYYDTRAIQEHNFRGTVSMRNLPPYYSQSILPMLGEVKFSTAESPALAIRQTPWGNLSSSDYVWVSGSYEEHFTLLPKRAIGFAINN